MPILIHLNGPSGVGKSTLAQTYADDHPGVLNLDIDTVVSLIGGWRENFFAALSPARHLALAMAEAHLLNGWDVVMPQLVTNVGEAERFEAAAERAGAEYLEIALTVDPVEQVNRFRAKARCSEVGAHIERSVTAEGETTCFDESINTSVPTSLCGLPHCDSAPLALTSMRPTHRCWQS